MNSFEKTLNKINSLDTRIFDLKRSIQKNIDEVTARYLIAVRKKWPSVPDYGSFSVDADEWYINKIDGCIHVRIYGGHEDADEYDIPLEYFTDESALKAFEEECEKVKEEREANEVKRKEEKEREEFERLKKKFESEE